MKKKIGKKLVRVLKVICLKNYSKKIYIKIFLKKQTLHLDIESIVQIH